MEKRKKVVKRKHRHRYFLRVAGIAADGKYAPTEKAYCDCGKVQP